MAPDAFLRIDGPGPEFDAVGRALDTWPPVAPTNRSAGFFWVRGPERPERPERPEPAYWDGERWSMLSSVTVEPSVLAETPLRFEDV
jgi:hypothetical protein